MQLNEQLLKRVDFDALVVFMVVLREGQVSRAASALGLTQPAVSNVLNRLRRDFADPLFVRCSNGVSPTPRATMIAGLLNPILIELQEVITMLKVD
ncbi:LysR family transcriptional regulator [Pseudomonas sp. NPDC089534]|uniref:LysR family transcriptional regulator n=1 Tax=Pseudomonas sp. NPDC089534 TaxID=3364468 RepID=UPI0038051032